MITVIAEFKLPNPITLEEAKKIFLSTAPNYGQVPGLVRKYYALSADGSTVGGIYLWESRAQAEAMYAGSWREIVRGKYGVEPSVSYFDTPVVVDNLTHEIITDK